MLGASRFSLGRAAHGQNSLAWTTVCIKLAFLLGQMFTAREFGRAGSPKTELVGNTPKCYGSGRCHQDGDCLVGKKFSIAPLTFSQKAAPTQSPLVWEVLPGVRFFAAVLLVTS